MSEELKRSIPKAVPFGEKKEYTKEEQEKHDRDFEYILKQYGVLNENQCVQNHKITTSQK